MTREMIPYVMIYLTGVFLSSVSQVLLKKASQIKRDNWLKEYLNWRVIVGYGIFFGCTLLTILAYRGMPVSMASILETTGYIYVTIFGVTIFKEKVNAKKIIALAIIIAGVVLYAV